MWPIFRRIVAIPRTVSHTVRHRGLHGISPRTQIMGGVSASVSDRICLKPAAVRRAAISRPAAAVVSAVAPGHRGWEPIASRPPGRMRRWSACNPSSGSCHRPRLFTAKTLSNGSANAGSCSAAPRRSTTRPARTAAALRLVACRTMTAEGSTPHTRPCVARRLSSRIAIPGPQPISRTRSVGSTPSRPTAHTWRWRVDDRSAISHPASQPANPRGCLNGDRIASASFCFLFMTAVNSRLRAFRPWCLDPLLGTACQAESSMICTTIAP